MNAALALLRSALLGEDAPAPPPDNDSDVDDDDDDDDDGDGGAATKRTPLRTPGKGNLFTLNSF